jgi:hypothetical protein
MAKTAKTAEKNVFFDINKLPAEKGLLLFGLSMNRLSKSQNAQNCIEAIKHLSLKISKPFVGLNFIYSDFLYLYTDTPAFELKDSFMSRVIQHKNAVQKLVEKNRKEFQIQNAFCYTTWSQLYVGTKDFDQKMKELKTLYLKDKAYQKYLKEDCVFFGKKMTENQINFFLEESLMAYLCCYNQLHISNDFIENSQKWILFCYSGRPIKSMIYLAKLNPFKLQCSDNPYRNSHYDLETNQLINFDNVDLETYSIK